MKKKVQKKAKAGSTSQFSGTKVLGRVVFQYVQFDVPVKHAKDVAEAVHQAMSDEFYIAKIRASSVTDFEP